MFLMVLDNERGIQYDENRIKPGAPPRHEEEVIMKELTKENFEQEVSASQQLIVVDFWASWCGPCRMQAPVMEALEKELPQLKVCKVNVDQQGELAGRFGISSIPTLVFIRSGRSARQVIGYHSKEALKSIIKEIEMK